MIDDNFTARNPSTTMSHLALSLFGSFQATLDERPLSGFVSRKAQALLAYLAAEADRVHTRQELAGLLWPDYPESSARANLRSVLANVRNVIDDRRASPPFLTITRDAVGFNLSSDHHLDVAIFHQQLPSGPLDQTSVAQLEEALDGMSGTFLSGFSMADSPAFEEWTLLRRTTLERQIAAALLRLVHHYEEQGNHRQALYHALRWVDMDPWQEEAHRAVMRLLSASGQRSKALMQYETCRRMLAKELGVEPAEETSDLYQEIRAGEHGRSRGQGLRFRHAVPPPLAPLIGREAELVQLSEMLNEPTLRLITLVGPGGIGKTHLATAAAAACRHFRNGACLAPLAPLRSAEFMVPAVAKALDLSFHDGDELEEQLLDYLRHKELLLVMDNYEHLLDGVRLVVAILERAPGVKVLATSRLRLGVAGEQLVPVEGLAYPDEAEVENLGTPSLSDPHAAITLFRQYAQRMRPDFDLTGDNLADVARICALVSGMPLGIVLAASWIEMLEPGEICDEIAHDFNFLQTILSVVPERQQSLGTLFEHSWKLLSAQERSTYQQLALFHGGFTRSAALAVTGAGLSDLLALVHKFLLHRTSSNRYEFHELLRQFAVQKLTTSSADLKRARNQHSTYYLHLVQEWGADLRGSRQREVLAEIDADSENIGLAWQWAIEARQAALLDGVMNSLGLFYNWTGRYQEGEAACRLATEWVDGAATDEEARIAAQILGWQARFSRLLGRSADASRTAQHGLDLLDRLLANDLDVRSERAALLFELGQQTRDRAEAVALGEQSLALYRTLGDRWAVAQTLQFLGEHHLDRFKGSERGEQVLSESLRLFEALDDKHGVANVLRRLGFNANLHGQAEKSEALLRRSLDIYRQMGDRVNMARTFGNLASLLANNHGRFEDAHNMLEEGMMLARDLGHRRQVAVTAGMLAFTSVHMGRWQQAELEGQEGLNIAGEIGDLWITGFALWQLGDIALAEGNLKQAALCLRESVALERSTGSLARLHDVLISAGFVDRARGRSQGVDQSLAEVLPGILNDRLWFSAIRVLPLAALHALDQGQPEMAAELWTMAQGQPHIANSAWYRAVAGRHIEAAANSLSTAALAAAQERGRGRGLWETMAELLDGVESSDMR